MRRSVSGSIALHVQGQAVVSRYEGIREAVVQMGLCDGAAASLRKGSFRMSSMKEHQSRTDKVCVTERSPRRGAPQHPAALMLRPDRRLGQVSESRLNALQTGIDVRCRGRALDFILL
jgi:hypothetical protein